MITAAELHGEAALEGLRFDQVEKDYVILWLLHALSQPELAPNGWVFKGGTCLRHCYYAGYRFSEDLDFSCDPHAGNLDVAPALLEQVAAWIRENSGMQMATKAPQTSSGDFQVEIPMEYSRGGARSRGLPQVKIHLTFDEPILVKPVVCAVSPRYTDLSDFKIVAYSKKEIVAEKMRALLQQQKKWPRPRDLYDLWFILCQAKERFEPPELKGLFNEKCKVRQILPDFAGLTSERLREWNKDAWRNQLTPMMKTVPDFDQVWSDWVTTCRKIFA